MSPLLHCSNPGLIDLVYKLLGIRRCSAWESRDEAPSLGPSSWVLHPGVFATEECFLTMYMESSVMGDSLQALLGEVLGLGELPEMRARTLAGRGSQSGFVHGQLCCLFCGRT